MLLRLGWPRVDHRRALARWLSALVASDAAGRQRPQTSHVAARSFGRREGRSVVRGGLVALALLVLAELSVTLLPVQVNVEVRGSAGQVQMDGGQHAVVMPDLGSGARIRFEQPGPAEREYQIDGSDTTSRNDRDVSQFNSVQAAAWYRLMAWLRDEDSYSRWQDIRLRDLNDGHLIAQGREAVEASALPAAFSIESALQRPEAPATIRIEAADGSMQAELSIERDSHRARWRTGADDDNAPTWFFPNDAWPFAAEILHLVGRSAAAAMGVLAIMAAVGLAVQRSAALTSRSHLAHPPAWALGAAIVGVWFTAVLWVTVRVYHQLPHIVDAQAYYFQARILETGRTWLEQPRIVQLLDGFQQVEWNGRWFSQYPPGAPALYAAGGMFGVAWLVGPLTSLVMVGATALTGLLLFGRGVAFAALALLALSPFVLFQAGAFMSHPIAGGALAASLASFVLAWRTGRRTWYAVAGVLLGVAFDTREVAAILYALPYAGWLLAHRRWRAVLSVSAGALPFLALYLLYNLSTTGDALMLPRNLFNENDRWGFGALGSSGQHTLAAGLVNTDENLTLLQFDLFGWPPLATFAVIGMPFLLGRAGRFDVLLAACTGGFVVAYIGYFYHGIALGPRYYFEAVPALTLLAARGIQACVQTLRELGLSARASRAGALSVLALFCTWTLGYYLPHEIERRMDYGAIGNGRRLVLPFVETTLTGPQLARIAPPALVFVPNEDIFKSISALNCAQLDAEHVADCPVLLVNVGLNDGADLLADFPTRSVWIIQNRGDLVTLDRVRSAPASTASVDFSPR